MFICLFVSTICSTLLLYTHHHQHHHIFFIKRWQNAVVNTLAINYVFSVLYMYCRCIFTAHASVLFKSLWRSLFVSINHDDDDNDQIKLGIIKLYSALFMLSLTSFSLTTHTPFNYRDNIVKHISSVTAQITAIKYCATLRLSRDVTKFRKSIRIVF